MRDNYVAKNANKFNRGGAHPDKSKYDRTNRGGMTAHDAMTELDELDEDKAAFYHKQAMEDAAALQAYNDKNTHDIPHTLNDDFMFEEPLHFEDFE